MCKIHASSYTTRWTRDVPFVQRCSPCWLLPPAARQFDAACQAFFFFSHPFGQNLPSWTSALLLPSIESRFVMGPKRRHHDGWGQDL